MQEAIITRNTKGIRYFNSHGFEFLKKMANINLRSKKCMKHLNDLYDNIKHN
jgi:hypothetical protein